jgi:chromate transport protein ChrA
MPMHQVTRASFWALTLIGWLVSATILSLLARYFASFDEMSWTELWLTGVAINVLALVAGLAFARSRRRAGQLVSNRPRHGTPET